MKRAALMLSVAASCFAATTTTWEMTGYQDFLRGRISGLSLTRDGRLTLGSRLDTLFDSGQPEIWSVAQAPDGSLYLGTGHRGRLYKLDAAGKSSLVWSSDQSEIFAVAVDAKGVVYAGTSPDGNVYRIENGKATEYFSPGARYIWALKAAPDGSLFVGTGDQGKIFRVTATGTGSVYYDTGQSHVTCLELDLKGALLAGSEPNGILYRITAQNKAFVLYDANLPEIRAIVPSTDGNLYVAALGGSVARRIGSANGSVNGAAATIGPVIATVTVTDQQAGLAQPPKPEAAKASVVMQSAVTSSAGGTVDYAGVDKSALYVIHADNTVETLWSSKEENIYDVAMFNSSLLFVTDVQGRLYRLDRDRKATLVAQSNEGEATRLVESRGALLAATGNLGKILRLGAGTVSTGWFESPVHDSSTVARWGRLAWRGDAKGIAFKTRSGNSLRPDATWSDWSAALTDPEHSSITSPNARYIQWRAEFSGSSTPPSLDSVTIAYLPQNTPPNVRSINVSAVSGSSKSGPANAAAAAATASYAITVTDSGDAPATAGTPSQTLSRIPGQQVQIYWQADDPDGDRLLYNLYFRGEDETRWKLIRANMTENTYLLDADVFADGRYYFRVVASDALSNPADLAREAELVSSPILIDSTPPVVTAGAARRTGAMVEIDVDAEDRGSVLRRCEYSLDAGQWMPVEAADGVTDSARERFLVRIDKVSAGEHLVVVRVYDAAGNAGLTKVIVR